MIFFSLTFDMELAMNFATFHLETSICLRSGSEIVDEMGNVVSGGLSSTGLGKSMGLAS